MTRRHLVYAGLAVIPALFVPAWVGQGAPVRPSSEQLQEAEVAWGAACPRPLYMGLCLAPAKWARADACPDPARAPQRLQRVVRPPAKTRQIRQTLAALAARRGAEGPLRARARFLLADAALEDMLGVEAPRGLDFDPRHPAGAERSTQQFAHWLDSLSGPASEAVKGYEAVAAEPQAGPWALAARARIGLVWARMAEAILSLEIPRDLEDRDEWGNAPRRTFCAALEGKAAPLRDRARAALALCAAAPANGEASEDWPSICRTALAELGPAPTPAP